MANNLSPEATDQLAALAQTLAHNPKTRRQFVKLVQEVDPSKRFPDVESDELRESIKSEFAQRDQQAEANRVLQHQQNQRAGLISSGRFKEEDVKAMEKDVMEKHGISDYDIAAKVYSADTRPATPTSEIRSRSWEMPNMTKDNIANLGHHARDTAFKVIDEFKNKRRAS